MTKSLFCLPNFAMSGGNKVVREIMSLLLRDGQEVHAFVYDARRTYDGWAELPITMVDEVGDISGGGYDFVYFSNLFLVPLILPHIGNAYPVLISLAYESFHYGNTYEEAMADSPEFLKVLNLPISVIAGSRALQDLLSEKGKQSFYMPHGLDRSLFFPRTVAPSGAPRKRILLVGNLLLPWKGISDGLDAVELLSRDIDVEAVLITQSKGGHGKLSKYKFPIETHVEPPLSQVPEIYATCHALCSASWHEGFGLPPLEAFCIGLPVVCTKNHGVTDYGEDRVNLLLAEPNNPADLSSKLKQVLTRPELADRLIKAGFETQGKFNWHDTLTAFKHAQAEIERNAEAPVSLSAAEGAVLLEELETAGLYTPLHAYRSLQEFNSTIDVTCSALLDKQLSATDAAERLVSIRRQMKPFLANQTAEYYPAFKQCMDLSGLLIGLKDDEKFLDSVSKLATVRKVRPR